MQLQEFISLKLRKEEGTVGMIKDYQYFHKRHIFVEMENSLLIILRMVNSNHPHMYNLRFIVLMVDDHIRMSMSELNDEDYFPSTIELKYDENEEGPGDDSPPEYFSDDEDVSDTEDGIPSQDKNLLGGKVLSVWERYMPLL